MCGVFGVFGHQEAANLAYLGLHALQHRGQESAGIVASDGSRLRSHRAMGLVQAAFSSADLEALPGHAAIGHVRYSTAGRSHIKNAQPLAVDYALGSIALAHNGNLTNHEALRAELEAKGSIFQTSSDSETVLHFIARSGRPTPHERLIEALGRVEGAYSLVVLTTTSLIAVRDPMGIRPLSLGRIRRDEGEVMMVASEPTSFELLGGERLRDVEPGEMLVIDANGMRSLRPFEPAPRRMCLFEHVYFSRPDAVVEGASVYAGRKAMGRALALEHPVAREGPPAVVIPVPDSGLPAAIGYAEQSGLPFEMGLIRSHYVGRTFIEPQDAIRHFGVRLKLHPNRDVIAGRRVVVVDDSIVRGTTSRKIVKMIREAGAASVHVRVSSPPTRFPCYYGIATPTRAELIASSHSEKEIARYLDADDLGYLSLEGLITAVESVEPKEGGRPSRPRHCDACFTGNYPIAFARDEHGEPPKSPRMRVVESDQAPLRR